MMAKNALRSAFAALCAVALLGATATGVKADDIITYNFDFDNVAAGTLVSALLPATISINPAVQDFAYDENFLPIPGTLRWRIDPNAPAVPIVTTEAGQPSAPSGLNMMGDRLSPILISLNAPLNYFNAVTFTLDNDTFGDTAIDALLLDANGATVASVATNQTQPGGTYTLTSTNKAAQYVLLPAGANYDNLAITASTAPEPGTLILAGVGLLTGGIVRRKRRV
jgi:hypothetical protein